MADAQLSVSWDEYHKNICKGLGALQQRGEFVDMTIAADGHHVKVHQMIMSLVSPYIKELITSTQCPHPVVFLNKVTYGTLQSILEYVYTGEVLVTTEKIGEFLEACTALHIKGLENMNQNAEACVSNMYREAIQIERVEPKENKRKPPDQPHHAAKKPAFQETFESIGLSDDDNNMDDDDDDNMDDDVLATDSVGNKSDEAVDPRVGKRKPLQYSVSCYGNLQLVLNRCIYSLKYTRKNNERFWRCTSQQSGSCPASVATKDDQVLERMGAHNHPFHDLQILKRVRNENIFTALNDVEKAAAEKRSKLNKNSIFASLHPDATTD